MSQPEPSNPSRPDAAKGPSDARQAPDIWDLALDDLCQQMTGHTFNAHLSGSRPHDWQPEANTWVIAVRNSYSPEWLRHRLDRLVRRTLARYTPGLPEPSLTYVAAPPQAGPRHSKTEEEGRRGASIVPGDEPGPTGRDRNADESKAQAVAQARPAVDARPDSAAWKARLQPTDIYIKLKTSFRERALRRLKGAKLSVFMCLILHMDRDGTAAPGIERIMRETGLARGTVCSALDELASPPLGLVEKVPASQRRGCIRMPNCYRIRGYAWWGAKPAPALYEEKASW